MARPLTNCGFTRDYSEERIEKVTESGCWIWLGRLDLDGYGRADVPKSAYLAHRMVYQRDGGIIPAGLTLDHLCRVRCCVNPAHLEAVPHWINTLRKKTVTPKDAKRTHCYRGHPLAEGTSRRCKVCNAESCKQYYQRRKERVVKENET